MDSTNFTATQHSQRSKMFHDTKKSLRVLEAELENQKQHPATSYMLNRYSHSIEFNKSRLEKLLRDFEKEKAEIEEKIRKAEADYEKEQTSLTERVKPKMLIKAEIEARERVSEYVKWWGKFPVPTPFDSEIPPPVEVPAPPLTVVPSPVATPLPPAPEPKVSSSYSGGETEAQMMARIEREVQQEAREARKQKAMEEKFHWEGREVSEFEYKILSARSKVVDYSALQDQYHKPSKIHDDTESDEEEEEESSESELDEEDYKKLVIAQKAELKRKHEERMKQKNVSFYTPPAPPVEEKRNIVSNTKMRKQLKTRI